MNEADEKPGKKASIAGSVPFEFKIDRGDSEGYERWLRTVAPLFDVHPLVGQGAEGFSIDCKGTFFGGLSQSRQVISPTRYDRNSRVIARSGNDQVMVTVYFDGAVTVSAEDQVLQLAAGDIVLLDMTQRCQLQNAHGSNLTLLLQRQLLTPHVPNIEALHGSVLRLSQPLNRLLLSHLEAIERVSPGFSQAEADAAAQTTIGMVSACFNAAYAATVAASDQAAGSKLLAICHMIERHLGDPDLGPDLISAKFGLGRATLYRLFESRGGVAAYIRSRRLSIAFRALSHANPAGFHIGVLARDLGFVSESSFSQIFRKTFGVKPSDVLRGLKAPLDFQPDDPNHGDAELHRVNRWLLGLKRE